MDRRVWASFGVVLHADDAAAYYCRLREDVEAPENELQKGGAPYAAAPPPLGEHEERFRKSHNRRIRALDNSRAAKF